jgi:hypothetical protein
LCPAMLVWHMLCRTMSRLGRRRDRCMRQQRLVLRRLGRCRNQGGFIWSCWMREVRSRRHSRLRGGLTVTITLRATPLDTSPAPGWVTQHTPGSTTNWPTICTSLAPTTTPGTTRKSVMR